MKKNHLLQVVEVQNGNPGGNKTYQRKSSREEIRAVFERMWLMNPEQFDPSRNCTERERIQRTKELIAKHIPLQQKESVDLGCGLGVLSIFLSEQGARVDAVDVASNAVHRLNEINIPAINVLQDCLPSTLLNDDAYDLVVCTELIAYLDERNHRLLFNELSRLMKKEGFVICSTQIDVDSEDALQNFAALAQTEFEFLEWVFSYHRLHIKLRRFLEAPFWKAASFFATPLAKFVRQNRALMLLLEKLSRSWYGEAGISHAMFIAKRHPLFEQQPEHSPDIERKVKKIIWE